MLHFSDQNPCQFHLEGKETELPLELTGVTAFPVFSLTAILGGFLIFQFLRYINTGLQFLMDLDEPKFSHVKIIKSVCLIEARN